MTPEIAAQVAAIRARHEQGAAEVYGLCEYCGLDWPCDTAALLALLPVVWQAALGAAAQVADRTAKEHDDLAQANAEFSMKAESYLSKALTADGIACVIRALPFPEPR